MNKNSIYIGTHNQEKYKKICSLISLVNSDITCVSLPLETSKAQERGSNEKENALIKAEYYFKKVKHLVIAEDTGIYLDNIPKEVTLGCYVQRSMQKIRERYNGDSKKIQLHWNKLITDNNITTGFLKHAFCIKTDKGIFTSLVKVDLGVVTSSSKEYDPFNLNSHLKPFGFDTTYQDISNKERKKYYQEYFLPKLKVLFKEIA
jgi:inosine/xanthosine triphosphate pyrophosphatase family protein